MTLDEWTSQISLNKFYEIRELSEELALFIDLQKSKTKPQEIEIILKWYEYFSLE